MRLFHLNVLKNLKNFFLKERNMFDLIWKSVVICVALLAGVLSYRYFNMPPNNPIEETAEYIVYDITGLDVDLSPEYPEN